MGAIALAGATAPFRAALAAFGVSDDAYGTRVPTQMAARLALAALVVASLGRFRRALGSALGPPVGVAFALLTATQFHLLFYASRTLPNVFALVLTTLGAADWFEGRRHRRAVFLLVLAAIVFRCDAVLLLAPVGLHMLFTRSLTVPQAISWGARCLLAALSLTIVVDAVMWRPPDAPPGTPRRRGGSGRFWPGAAGVLWPEGAVLGSTPPKIKARRGACPRGTGTSPPRSPARCYWRTRSRFSARRWNPADGGGARRRDVRRALFLPPAQGTSIHLPGGASDERVRGVRGAFCRPRKVVEILAIEVVQVLAIEGASRLDAGVVRRVVRLRRRAHVVFAAAARANYPGGVAFARLHARGDTPGAVHVDAAAAMTGVSRFGHALGDGWSYSKDESMDDDDIAARDSTGRFRETVLRGFEVVDVVEGYAGMRVVRWKGVPLGIRVAKAPAMWIHARRREGSEEGRSPGGAGSVGVGRTRVDRACRTARSRVFSSESTVRLKNFPLNIRPTKGRRRVGSVPFSDVCVQEFFQTAPVALSRRRRRRVCGRGGTRPTRDGEAARNDQSARARPREGRFDSRAMSKLHENHVVPPDRLTGTNSIRNSGHNLDLLTAGRDPGRRRTGVYAPQNFPPKPSPLPNDNDFQERCVERPSARACPSGDGETTGAPPLFDFDTGGKNVRQKPRGRFDRAFERRR